MVSRPQRAGSISQTKLRSATPPTFLTTILSGPAWAGGGKTRVASRWWPEPVACSTAVGAMSAPAGPPPAPRATIARITAARTNERIVGLLLISGSIVPAALRAGNAGQESDQALGGGAGKIGRAHV